MKAFHVISTLLFIGVLSVISAQVNPPDMGIAMIRYSPFVRNSRNILCSGVFLNSWIVLTTATCVEGRTPNDLAVDYTIRFEGSVVNYYPMLVRNITESPDYVRGQYENDMALLLLNVASHWDVEPFVIPDNDYPAQIVIDNNMDTFVNYWTKLESGAPSIVQQRITLTTNYTYCDGTDVVLSSYCGKLSLSRVRDLENAARAIPLFFKEDNKKLLLGLLIDRHSQDTKINFLFLNIFSGSNWIRNYITDNPTPPLHQ